MCKGPGLVGGRRVWQAVQSGWSVIGHGPEWGTEPEHERT